MTKYPLLQPFISSTRSVILNKRAYDILEMKVNEVFDLAVARINPYFEDILKKFEQDIVIDQKAHVILLMVNIRYSTILQQGYLIKN